MHILFVSNYFPPEVNAPATRLYEHAKQWVADGHRVDVLTAVPNFPEGAVYDGYQNTLTREVIDGIHVTRVPMYIAPNEGTVKRILSYLSFMVSSAWYASGITRPDVVVATSPQFFAAVGGYGIARRLGAPFVMEVRDLWPESVVAVGAMERNLIIRCLEQLESFLYRQAERIVVVTNSFKRAIAAKGISAQKISVLKNGADLDVWAQPLDEERLEALRDAHDLRNKFVVSYIGTIGMAHRVDVMLEAAQQCDDPDIIFAVVGAGAEWDTLQAQQEALQLPNVRLVGKVPKEDVPYMLALTDASLVHLKASDLFKTVIPSKMFESMATRTPIILGVEGEAKEIVQEAGAGLCIPPEDAGALVEAAKQLKDNPKLHAQYGASGYHHVHEFYDRTTLARRYADMLMDVA
jgi:glycosyltransferase involved in cell wall biosynthesis